MSKKKKEEAMETMDSILDTGNKTPEETNDSDGAHHSNHQNKPDEREGDGEETPTEFPRGTEDEPLPVADQVDRQEEVEDAKARARQIRPSFAHDHTSAGQPDMTHRPRFS